MWFLAQICKTIIGKSTQEDSPEVSQGCRIKVSIVSNKSWSVVLNNVVMIVRHYLEERKPEIAMKSKYYAWKFYSPAKAGPWRGRATYWGCQLLDQISPPATHSAAPGVDLSLHFIPRLGFCTRGALHMKPIKSQGLSILSGTDTVYSWKKEETTKTIVIAAPRDQPVDKLDWLWVFLSKRTCCKKRFVKVPEEPSMDRQIPILPKLWKVWGVPPVMVEVPVSKEEKFSWDV